MICPCGCGRELQAPAFTRFQGHTAFIETWVESLGLTMEIVRGRRQTSDIVQIRREIALYLWHHEWSTPQIGRFLERDHTTILNLLGRRKPVLKVLDARQSQ